MTADEQLSEIMKKLRDKPLEYVMFAFPWRTESSIQKVEMAPEYQERFKCKYGPDRWACEFLDQLGEEIRKRGYTGTAVEPIKFTTASGRGIGKSTLTSWLIKFILDTRPMSMGVVTANTSEQLKTKTWAELSKWNRLSITKHWWAYTAGRGAMSLYYKLDPELSAKWRCDAQTCKEENAEAFQGLHAADSTPFYIFDEASGIPDKIFEARSGSALTGEPMWFDFGNPTRKSGYFFENSIGKYRHRFIARSIDSRSVAITGKGEMQTWIDDYGEDSDFVKVMVRGVFPSAGSTQFISSDLVKEAMVREAVMYPHDSLLIGVDVARFGSDSTIIFPRIGHDARSFPFRQFKGLDTVQVVEQVVECVQYFQKLGRRCKGLFIDGGGLGAGVVDMLRRLGYSPIDINFGGKPADPKYRFRVDEMWGRMRDDLPKLALIQNADLEAQLTQREYGFTVAGNKISLESKDDLKKRGLPSPDIADGLALTYASVPALEVRQDLSNMFSMQTISDYNPLESVW
jgi:hypothetical protein